MVGTHCVCMGPARAPLILMWPMLWCVTWWAWSNSLPVARLAGCTSRWHMRSGAWPAFMDQGKEDQRHIQHAKVSPVEIDMRAHPLQTSVATMLGAWREWATSCGGSQIQHARGPWQWTCACACRMARSARAQTEDEKANTSAAQFDSACS